MADASGHDAVRRDLLRATSVAVGGGLAGCVGLLGLDDDGLEGSGPEWTGQLVDDGPTVRLEPLASGLTYPTAVAGAAESDRWYVADQVGVVYRGSPDGLAEEPVLDLRDRVVEPDGFDERGLVGLALHPAFEENGRLYVRYSAPPRDGTPEDYSHTSILAEFQTENDGERAVPDSERILLEIPQPQYNHNSGSLAFGPDGYLYVGSGDGGDGNDTGLGHADDWYDGNDGGNGQRTSDTLLGGVLRIDVDDAGAESADGRPYGIPEDNPLVGIDGHRAEYYAWGLRNPWGISFDGEDCYVADVGQEHFEAVNRVELGCNYGWNVREGTHCFSTATPGDRPDSCPEQTPADYSESSLPAIRRGEPLLDPIVEYPHVHDGEDVGQAVVGGYVYRGDDLPALRGQYLFGDWSTEWDEPEGSLFVAAPPDDRPGGDSPNGLDDSTDVHEYVAARDLWPMRRLQVESPDDAAEGGELQRFVTSIGRTADGEPLVATAGRGVIEGETGAVHRIVPAG